MGEKVVLSYFPNQDPPTLAKVEKLVSAQLQHWAEHGYGWWAVVPRGSVELIGWAGLQFLPETNETEVAYLLARPYWGRGLATEAARASLEFGFDRLDLTCIVGIVHPKNIASRRVLEKAGLSLAEQSHYFGMDCLRYVVCRPSGDAPLCAMASSPVPAE
jgi:ribosomal-protein-alanine N-acetyltransferase